MVQLTGASLIGATDVHPTRGTFRALDPATGAELDPAYGEAGPAEVEQAAALAAEAFAVYRRTTGEQRAAFLESIAANIEALGSVLADRVSAETGLPSPRVAGETARTVGQLRLFAAVVRDGGWRGVRRDTPLPDRTPLPRPDLRQRAVPVGPVAVFGASNFPLAFSVAGGDTASALAAGCPVIVKAHPAHPGTSELVGRAVQQAVAEHGLPDGTFSVLQGTTLRAGHRAGRRAADPGRRLHRIAAGRPRAGRRSPAAARADPGLRRDVLGQPGLPAARCPGRAGRRHRRGVCDLGDRVRRPALHPTRACLRPREPRDRPLPRRLRGGPDRRGCHPDAHLPDGRGVRIGDAADGGDARRADGRHRHQSQSPDRLRRRPPVRHRRRHLLVQPRAGRGGLRAELARGPSSRQRPAAGRSWTPSRDS